VLGTQSAAPSVVPSGVLSMIQTRVCLQVASTKYSRIIIDNPDGAKLTGLGDLFYYDGGHLTRAQGYYMDTDEIEEHVNDLGCVSFKNVHERSQRSKPFKPSHEQGLNVHERSNERRLIGFQTPTDTMNDRERMKTKAVNLKAKNMSMQKIADELKCSKTHVYNLLHEDD